MSKAHSVCDNSARTDPRCADYRCVAQRYTPGEQRSRRGAFDSGKRRPAKARSEDAEGRDGVRDGHWGVSTAVQRRVERVARGPQTQAGGREKRVSRGQLDRGAHWSLGLEDAGEYIDSQTRCCRPSDWQWGARDRVQGRYVLC